MTWSPSFTREYLYSHQALGVGTRTDLASQMTPEQIVQHCVYCRVPSIKSTNSFQCLFIQLIRQNVIIQYILLLSLKTSVHTAILCTACDCHLIIRDIPPLPACNKNGMCDDRTERHSGMNHGQHLHTGIRHSIYNLQTGQVAPVCIIRPRLRVGINTR